MQGGSVGYVIVSEAGGGETRSAVVHGSNGEVCRYRKDNLIMKTDCR